MTPAEKAVIDAARAWAYALDEGDGEAEGEVIHSTVHALDKERAARPWSLVVAEDEVWSEKSKGWFLVLTAEKAEGAKVRVTLEGVPAPLTVPAATLVKVRRSEMGQAVDVWAGIEVVSS